VNSETLFAELVGAQQHGPRGGAHLAILVGLAFAALLFFGVSWWRRRRSVARQRSTPDDRAAESTTPKERT